MNRFSELAGRLAAQAEASGEIDVRAVRDEIHELAASAQSEEEHVLLLKLFHVVMDQAERGGSVAPDNLDAFREVRDQDYRLLLAREVVIGENASVELMDSVTSREIRAGRMPQDDPMRIVVNEAIKRPFLSIADLQKIEADRVAKESRPKGWRSWFGRG